MKFQQRSGHCVETGSQSGRGWVEGGDGEEEREGDLASPQGSSHILSLSPPALLLFLLCPFSSPFCFSFNTSPPWPCPCLPSTTCYGAVNLGLRLEQSMMARWSPVSHELEQQTNGHFVSLRNGCPRIPLLHHTLDQPASRLRAASGSHVLLFLLFSPLLFSSLGFIIIYYTVEV